MENQTILMVEKLNLYDRTGRRLLRDVSLSLRPGETLGLVGESGCGKTLTLKSLIGLLPEGLRETCAARVDNPDCAMIFQHPQSALDPLCPVFRQLTEVVALRQGVRGREARARAAALLERLSLPALAERDRLPGELSGGQCQRAVIALALACEPRVLLADEPTTALDVTVQRQTLALIRELQRERGFAMIFVTHNLAVAAQVCERLAVMRAGRIVEEGPAERILREPQTEYARMLVGSILPVPERRA